MSRYRTTVAGRTVRLNVLPKPWPEEAERFAEFCASDTVLGYDVETTAIEAGEAAPMFDPDARMRMVQFGTATQAWALDPHDEFWRPIIEDLLGDVSHPGTRFCSHTNYDALWARREFGIDLGQRSIDTLPMACLLYPGKFHDRTLKGLSAKLIDGTLVAAEARLHARFKELAPVGQRVGKALLSWGFTNIPLDDPAFDQYGGLDAVHVRILLDRLAALMAGRGAGHRAQRKLSLREQRIQRMANDMQWRGMRLDQEWTAEVLGEISEQVLGARERLEERWGFAALSPKRGAWLEERGVEFTEFTEKTGQPKLDAENVGELAAIYAEDEQLGPIFADMVQLSSGSNLYNNLRAAVKSAKHDGNVHPRINTQAAVTGRQSATSPAMQTFKKDDKRLRGCWIARDGYALVRADYASQEIRLAAAFSRDKFILKILRDDLNQHDETARSMFGLEFTERQRHSAKTYNFASQYGAGPKKLARQLGIPYREARKMWLQWRETYAGLVAWTDAMAERTVVVNPWGRRIPRDRWRHFANGNYMIQSSGRDVLGDALCNLEDAGWAPYLWLPIHDEIVLEVPEHLADKAMTALEECMTTSVLGVPLTVETEFLGSRWSGES